jgi:hypothetical protein
MIIGPPGTFPVSQWANLPLGMVHKHNVFVTLRAEFVTRCSAKQNV